jgi:hypothetical protein
MHNLGEIGNRLLARESDPETGLYYHRARYYDPIYQQILEEREPDAMTWKASRATYVGGLNTSLAGPGTRSGHGGAFAFSTDFHNSFESHPSRKPFQSLNLLPTVSRLTHPFESLTSYP